MTGGRRDGGVRVLALATVMALSVLVGPVGSVGASSAANGPTTIDDCTIINESGTYELASDFENVNNSRMIGGANYRAVCIDVRASDVILDGNGHLLDSASQESTSNQRAVYVNGSAERRENVTVRNVEFTDWPRGVYVYNASGLRVADVTVRLRNDSDLRGRLGVRFHGVRNSVVEGSTFQGYPAGIRATKGYRQPKNANNRYVSNTFQGKGDIRIHEAKNVTVEGNTFSTDGATAWGTYVDSEGGSVANNVVDGGAIWLGGTGTTVQTNTVRDTDISLSSDHFALEIGGDGHDVRNNTVVNASRGMGVGGRDHVLRDNELRNSRENFHVGTFRSTTDADPASFDVDQSNTVDGKPIYVFGGVSGHTLSGVNAGYVAYADSTDVTVRDVRVSNATEGLYLHNVSGLTVENATLSENGNGIVARGAENVTVRDSRLTDNTFNGIEVAAIYLGERAKHWTLDNVTITGAGQEVDRLEREEDNVGVFYEGTNVTIADSNVSHNTNGLAFIDAENVTLRDSVVSDNGGDGVWLRAGSSEFVGNDVSDNGNNGIIAWTGRAMVANNTFDRNGWSGLRIGRLVREGTIYIRNNTAGDNTYGIGIFPDSPGDFVSDDITLDDNVVVGNNVTDNQYGIYLADRAENNTLRNNTARLNEVGIHLSNTANNRVVDNNASDNSDDGIRLDGYDGKKTMETDAFVVRNNSLVSNGDDGVALDDATTGSNYESGPFAVRDNDVRANGDEGIVVEWSENVTIADNGRVYDNGGSGIYIRGTTNASVVNHTATGNGAGVTLEDSDVTVANLDASGNDGDGIELVDLTGLDLGPNVTVEDNGGSGVEALDVGALSVRRVSATGNGNHGLYLTDTWNATFRDVDVSDSSGLGVRLLMENGPAENVTFRNLTAERADVFVDGPDAVSIENSIVTDTDDTGVTWRTAPTAASATPRSPDTTVPGSPRPASPAGSR